MGLSVTIWPQHFSAPAADPPPPNNNNNRLWTATAVLCTVPLMSNAAATKLTPTGDRIGAGFDKFPAVGLLHYRALPNASSAIC
jgi:hypothetical protein